MKHVCLILATFAACIAMMHAATNDYIWSQKPASGPLVSRNLTPVVGRLVGFPSSINAPDTIIIGSGLTLTGSTLSASGSGSVATDSIFDAAGDLVQGTGANTSARVALGTSGQLLRVKSDLSGVEWATVSGTGTVTSVAMSVPSILSVAGSPVTTSGTLAVTLATQAANRIFAGPATGADATPAFRALVADDIPSLSGVYQPLNSRLTGIGALTPGAAEKAILLEADGTMSTKAYTYGGNGSADEGLIPEFSIGGLLYAGGSATGDAGLIAYTLDSNAVIGQSVDGTGATGVGVFGYSSDATAEGYGVRAGHSSATGIALAAGPVNIGANPAALRVYGDGTTTLGGGTSASEFRFLEPSGSGSNYFGWKAQAMSANAVFTLPAADGTSGQVLKTNGSKVLSFGDVAPANISGLGTGVATALGVNVGSAGAFVTFNGALGTPSSGTATNLTGTASGLTAGTVTTNANMTGDVTSSGSNATTLAAMTAPGPLLAENASIRLDPAGSADGKYSGTTVTGTAGTTLAFGDVVVLDVTDSRWELADANSSAAADGDSRAMLGICVLAAASDGSATTILLHGIVRADTAFPTFTISAPIYVSETAGDATSTQPTTADVLIRVIGHALTGDEMFFNPDNSWITHL